MRRYAALLLIVCLALSAAAGCSNAGASAQNRGAKAKEADVDLTELSGVMAYAQIVNILEKPDDYTGKTIKMTGQYRALYFDPTQLYYHFVVIGDEALCCQAWVEFVWSGEHTYPDGYPDEQEEIEVAGVFGSYEELGLTYYYLAVDDIKIL